MKTHKFLMGSVGSALILYLYCLGRSFVLGGSFLKVLLSSLLEGVLKGQPSIKRNTLKPQHKKHVYRGAFCIFKGEIKTKVFYRCACSICLGAYQ